MRQTQQNNRRGRGRGKKTQNPFSKNFESNGPDVKIRGTASHIADKYQSLSRDSMSSGDFIKSENYLQHAEHYNRIMMAAQNAQAKANEKTDDSATHAQVDGNKLDEVGADDGHVLEDFDLTLSQVNSGSNNRNHKGRGNGRKNNGRDQDEGGSRTRRTRTGEKHSRGRRSNGDNRPDKSSERKHQPTTQASEPSASKEVKEAAKGTKSDVKEVPIG